MVFIIQIHLYRIKLNNGCLDYHSVTLPNFSVPQYRLPTVRLPVATALHLWKVSLVSGSRSLVLITPASARFSASPMSQLHFLHKTKNHSISNRPNTLSIPGAGWKGRKEGRKEMFYLTMHSTVIYGYIASDIW